MEKFGRFLYAFVLVTPPLPILYGGYVNDADLFLQQQIQEDIVERILKTAQMFKHSKIHMTKSLTFIIILLVPKHCKQPMPRLLFFKLTSCSNSFF